MTTWDEHAAARPLRGAARAAYDAERAAMGVGYLILRARAAAGYTQAELAEEIGTSQPTIARWESGAQSPSVRSLTRVAAATGFELRIGFRDAHARVVDVAVR
jgi:DNA-binding XRE family transcriptional regulator